MKKNAVVRADGQLNFNVTRQLTAPRAFVPRNNCIIKSRTRKSIIYLPFSFLHQNLHIAVYIFVPVLAGLELIFSIVASWGLYFAFVLKTLIM